MKVSLRYIGIGILFLGGLLTACSGNTVDNEPLPTLAQLPTVTPVINPAATIQNSSTPIPSTDGIQVEPTNITPNPLVLPNPLPLSVNAEATAAVEGALGAFPEILEVGTTIMLQGTLTTDDVNSGAAVLTNSSGQTVHLLVDPFTAMTANKQEVEVTGVVEQQAGNPANAIRVTGINMLNGASALATATDFPLPDVPTSTP